MWQLVMLVLSIFVLGIVFVETVFALPKDITAILDALDNAVCLVFIGDFFFRLQRAEKKLAFLKWGWIDLVSSIPSVDLFRWGRLVRVFRILRAVRSAKALLTFFRAHRSRSAFAAAILITLTVVIFASIVVLNLEDRADSNIKNGEDALWWAVSTVTTVGYGDRYPVTTGGRVLGAVLMTVGIGFAGTLTAYLASLFLHQNGDQKEQESIDARLSRIERMLEDMKRDRGAKLD